MKMVPLNRLFNVEYGNKFDLNKMEFVSKADGGINFVGRSSQNHGVTGTVAGNPRVDPYPAGCVTVSLGGTKLLSSFVQMEPFYTAQNVAVLRAKEEMTFAQKLYICLCIRHNRFRYSAFGREANRTLRTLPVPDRSEFPSWLTSVSIDAMQRDYASPLSPEPAGRLDPSGWKWFRLSELFQIGKGKRLTKADMEPGDTPFIGAIESDNGIRQRISAKPRHSGNLITVNYNGSVAEAFYQPDPFWASDDVNVLYPQFEMDPLLGLFICTVIRQEKYRFNYGRKWNLERMREAQIRLPATSDGSPDWDSMRRFMAALPFSSALDPDVRGNEQRAAA